MKVGITFGGYCPMHQGHLDLIMQAKKENDICYVIVCGYNNEPRAKETGLTLDCRYTLIKQMFKKDEQIRVLKVNDTELGIDESMSNSNWDIWLNYVQNQIILDLDNNEFIWYVGEPQYALALQDRLNYSRIIDDVIFINRIKHPISATMIRENPIKYWNQIAYPFRQYFSVNILITGTASEGKSTLTKDISTYFGIPHVPEYGRSYMEDSGKSDTDLNVNHFMNFLIQQCYHTQREIKHFNNPGIVISDTDSLVTLMYAKAYIDDEDIDITKEDYEKLEKLALDLKKRITWDKIFLLPPKNTFINDGCRYMKQSSIEERLKNYNILVDLIKQFGWWDKVEIIDGNFYENFNSVKRYIESKIK